MTLISATEESKGAFRKATIVQEKFIAGARHTIIRCAKAGRTIGVTAGAGTGCNEHIVRAHIRAYEVK
jgi:hypothetical protein